MEDYSIDLTDILNTSFISSDLSANSVEIPYLNSEHFRFIKEKTWGKLERKNSDLNELNEVNMSDDGSVYGKDFPVKTVDLSSITVKDKCVLKGMLKFDPNVDQSRRAYPSYYGGIRA